MIVFVESNFVLELVLRQREAIFANEIVELAEQKRIQLCIPAFSLVEPYQKLVREKSDRNVLKEALETQVKQMSRSADFADIRTQSTALLIALAQKADNDMSEHRSLIFRIIKCSKVLPLTEDVLAAGLARSFFDLELLDSFVYASIEAELKQSSSKESVFANRDAKGFMQQTVLGNLESLGCKVIPTFEGAAAFVKGQLNK